MAFAGSNRTAQGDRAMLNFPYPLNVMFPGAAGNWQAFDARFLSPNVSVNFAGNPTVEREVTEEVASYGTQIGWLNDIVYTLAKAAPDSVGNDPDAKAALYKLDEAMKKIDKIKSRRKTNAYDQARDAIAELGQTDKAGYGRLVRTLDPENPPSAS
jgi:hypothetical protein